MRKSAFCICENKDLINCAVTAQQFNAHVFAIRIVLSLHFLSPKFQASIFYDCTARFVSNLVGNPEDLFSHSEAHLVVCETATSSHCSFFAKSPYIILSEPPSLSQSLVRYCPVSHNVSWYDVFLQYYSPKGRCFQTILYV